MKIEALHEFHDKTFSEQWANKFTPTKDRLDLFETMMKNIKNEKEIFILELGIGPGFLAYYLLSNLNQIQYEGLDFSSSMLNIAKERTKEFKNRISFLKADLVNEVWTKKIKQQPDIVVSTWALHDLFSDENIFNVYEAVYKILPKGGILLNGDFIKPEESTFEYEGGRIKPSQHIDLLNLAGFNFVQCLREFEKNIEKPTTANNYSCFKAIK